MLNIFKKILVFLIVLFVAFCLIPSKKVEGVEGVEIRFDDWYKNTMFNINMTAISMEYNPETGENNLGLELEPGLEDTEVLKEMLTPYEEVYQYYLDMMFGVKEETNEED